MDKTLTERQLARRLERKKLRERQKKLLATYEARLKRQKEAVKRWKKANPDKVAAQQARYYAKKIEENARRAQEILQTQAQEAQEAPPALEIPVDKTDWAAHWAHLDALKAKKAPDAVEELAFEPKM